MTEPTGDPASPAPGLLEVLRQSQAAGFIGPGDLDPHIRQAAAFAAACSVVGIDAPDRVLDLGSGGGLPGLVLLGCWPSADVALLDASEQRTAFLASAVQELGADSRAEVIRGRAEGLARDPRWRGTFDLVVSRSFGSPALVAECGGGFLAEEGALVVSEPPGSDGTRWTGLDEAGLGLVRDRLVTADGHSFQVIRAAGPFPGDRPRRVGIPAKRPLF